MIPPIVAVTIALAIFAAGGAGLTLQRTIPEAYTTGAGRDMIGAVVGLFTLLSALVLGLLIWTAYGVYAGQSIAIQGLAGKIVQLDQALIDYGPDAAQVRKTLHRRMDDTITEVWGTRAGDAKFAADNFAAAVSVGKVKEQIASTLDPKTETQKQALATVLQTLDSIAQTRMKMSLALADPVCYPVVLIVVGWTMFLFFGFGITGRANVTSTLAVAVGACAVGTAFLLILGLSNPYSGVFRASPQALVQVLEYAKAH